MTRQPESGTSKTATGLRSFANGQITPPLNSDFDTWAPIPPYPDMLGGGATALVVGDEVIVWGGRNVSEGGARDAATNLGYRLSF